MDVHKYLAHDGAMCCRRGELLLVGTQKRLSPFDGIFTEVFQLADQVINIINYNAMHTERSGG